MSETEAIQEGIEALRHEADVLKCFESEIGWRHDALMADPSLGIPIEEVERRLRISRSESLRSS